MYRYLRSGMRFIIRRRATLSVMVYLILFPTTPILSTATEDIRSPNTMTSVTCYRAVLKLSSNLNGCPTNSG